MTKLEIVAIIVLLAIQIPRIQLVLVDYLTADCIPGEAWSETCKTCHCNEVGKAICSKDQAACKFVSHRLTLPAIIFSENHRCHKAGSDSVCVRTVFQEGLSHRKCMPDGLFFYDSCTWCGCIGRRTRCMPLQCNNLISLCRLHVQNYHGCHKCECSKTLFKMCIPDTNCLERKPGRCPKHLPSPGVSSSNQLWCVLSLRQECQHDAQCPETRKCCLQGCYYRCMLPLEDKD